MKKAMNGSQDLPIKTLDNHLNDQNVDRQLNSVALDKVFTEKLSGANTDSPQLQPMLGYVREGDITLVHSIDR